MIVTEVQYYTMVATDIELTMNVHRNCTRGVARGVDWQLHNKMPPIQSMIHAAVERQEE
jgi:hypothetical protein